MKRNVRLISYLNMLYTNEFISADYFSNLFNISIRTVFRDIKTIENLGIEIQVEPKKGYYIQNGIPIQYLSFNKKEIEALNQVYIEIENIKSNILIEDYKSAIDKISPFIKIGN